MITELKSLMTQNLESIDKYQPTDIESFEVKIEACIGSKDSEGGDNFIITVVTPKFLDQKYSKSDAPFLLHTMLVKEWNPNLIRERIQKMVSSISGKDWSEISLKLSRFGYWEFEDCRPI
ncbi:MAG: Imm8 family immunity protein [Proteobacteria bacterium]|nr:Imm8 family immunity protein [Pseudomonadota bacterium]